MFGLPAALTSRAKWQARLPPSHSLLQCCNRCAKTTIVSPTAKSRDTGTGTGRGSGTATVTMTARYTASSTHKSPPSTDSFEPACNVKKLFNGDYIVLSGCTSLSLPHPTCMTQPPFGSVRRQAAITNVNARSHTQCKRREFMQACVCVCVWVSVTHTNLTLQPPNHLAVLCNMVQEEHESLYPRADQTDGFLRHPFDLALPLPCFLAMPTNYYVHLSHVGNM